MNKFVDIYENIVAYLFQKKYDKLFNEIHKLSKRSYKLEAKCRNKILTTKLTKKQKQEIKSFWNKYTKDFNFDNHEFYINISQKFDVRYIPDYIYAGYIEKYFNNSKLESGFSDKNYFDLLLDGFPKPKTFLHYIDGVFLDNNYKIITKKDARNILLKEKKFVMKKTIGTSGGLGVKIFDNVNAKQISNILDNLCESNILFQEIVSQSPILEKLNKSSLNTIRIMSFMIDNEVYLSHGVVRAGKEGEKVDNASNGGVFYSILNDDTLSNDSIDLTGKIYENSLSKINYKNDKLPFMYETREMIKQAAQRFPHFKIIAWDIGIDKNDKPIIIEYNIANSIPDIIQLTGNPVFGEHTELILKKVFLEGKKEKEGIDSGQYI